MGAIAVEERPGTVDEVLARYKAEPAALSIIGAASSPADAVERLSEAGHADDAIQFLARWLTKREAIWWGTLCVWDALRPKLDANREALLQDIVQWVLEPTEERRQVLGVGKRKAKKSHPETSLAVAAFNSDGSISLPGRPEVMAEEDMTAMLVAKTLKMTGTLVPGSRRAEAYRQFLRFGLEVIEGKSRWAEETEE